MPYAILSLWWPSIALGWLALAGILLRRLGLRFLPLAVFLAVQGVRALFRALVHALGFFPAFHEWFYQHFHPIGRLQALLASYPAAWSATEPISFFIEAVLALSVFQVLSTHFKNFSKWSFRLQIAILALAFPSIFVSRSATPSGPMAPVLSIIRDAGVFWGAFVALTIILFFVLQSRGAVPISVNAKHHAGIVLTYFAGSVASNSLISLPDIPERFIGQILMQVVAVFCYGAWLFALTREGERTEVVPRLGGETPEEMESAIKIRLKALSKSAGR